MEQQRRTISTPHIYFGIEGFKRLKKGIKWQFELDFMEKITEKLAVQGGGGGISNRTETEDS
jgi:hypothetical protein